MIFGDEFNFRIGFEDFTITQSIFQSGKNYFWIRFLEQTGLFVKPEEDECFWRPEQLVYDFGETIAKSTELLFWTKPKQIIGRSHRGEPKPSVITFVDPIDNETVNPENIVFDSKETFFKILKQQVDVTPKNNGKEEIDDGTKNKIPEKWRGLDLDIDPNAKMPDISTLHVTRLEDKDIAFIRYMEVKICPIDICHVCLCIFDCDHYYRGTSKKDRGLHNAEYLKHIKVCLDDKKNNSFNFPYLDYILHTADHLDVLLPLYREKFFDSVENKLVLDVNPFCRSNF